MKSAFDTGKSLMGFFSRKIQDISDFVVRDLHGGGGRSIASGESYTGELVRLWLSRFHLGWWKDGTKVPMFVVHHKSMEMQLLAPCMGNLHLWHSTPGYGGFSIFINLFFSITFLTLAQKYGFILAVPNIRSSVRDGIWLAAVRGHYIGILSMPTHSILLSP